MRSAQDLKINQASGQYHKHFPLVNNSCFTLSYLVSKIASGAYRSSFFRYNGNLGRKFLDIDNWGLYYKNFTVVIYRFLQ